MLGAHANTSAPLVVESDMDEEKEYGDGKEARYQIPSKREQVPFRTEDYFPGSSLFYRERNMRVSPPLPRCHQNQPIRESRSTQDSPQ